MTNMTLYFKNSRGVRRKIGEPADEKEAFAAIHNFLKEHNFTSYYTRTWINPDNHNEKYYDVGSHTEFFICDNPEGWNESV